MFPASVFFNLIICYLLLQLKGGSIPKSYGLFLRPALLLMVVIKVGKLLRWKGSMLVLNWGVGHSLCAWDLEFLDTANYLTNRLLVLVFQNMIFEIFLLLIVEQVSIF